MAGLIKKELQKLNDTDLWSLMLFVLYKVKEVPEFAGLSELAYVLDKKNMLKLCEYFGGTTITVPRVEEMEELIYSLLLYQYVKIDGIEFDDAIELLKRNKDIDVPRVTTKYIKMCKVMEDYSFTPRGTQC